jgi:predicted RNA-binding Zn ribbon-like protein
MWWLAVDEARWARLGEDLQPGGRAAPPGPIRIVQQFLNTSNHEVGHELDKLRTPDRARQWLAAHGLLQPSDTVSEEELEALCAFRDALREYLLAPSPGAARTTRLAALNTASARAPLAVTFDEPPASLRLVPAARGIDRAIGHILAAVHAAASSGQLARLKGCGQCGWAFFDRSKNRSGTWCAMAVCGNRLKNRSLRARKKARGA